MTHHDRRAHTHTCTSIYTDVAWEPSLTRPCARGLLCTCTGAGHPRAACTCNAVCIICTYTNHRCNLRPPVAGLVRYALAFDYCYVERGARLVKPRQLCG